VLGGRKQEDENPFGGLGGSSLTPAPVDGTGQETVRDEEDDFPDPTPSRANVVEALAIADDETDVDIAGYYVQRAIAETLLLIHDQMADGRSGSSQT
jgi:hypothetical protein